jgi:hypothetical protein
MAVSIRDCSACGGDHPNVSCQAFDGLVKLISHPESYTHFAICPVSGRTIFISVRQDDAFTGMNVGFPQSPDQDPGTDASKFLAGARQPAPTGTGPEITPGVIKDLEERYRYGKGKYGEGLRAHNGRDPLIDLYQELLDAVLYTRQALEERYGQGPERGPDPPPEVQG